MLFLPVQNYGEKKWNVLNAFYQRVTIPFGND